MSPRVLFRLTTLCGCRKYIRPYFGMRNNPPRKIEVPMIRPICMASFDDLTTTSVIARTFVFHDAKQKGRTFIFEYLEKDE